RVPRLPSSTSRTSALSWISSTSRRSSRSSLDADPLDLRRPLDVGDRLLVLPDRRLHGDLPLGRRAPRRQVPPRARALPVRSTAHPPAAHGGCRPHPFVDQAARPLGGRGALPHLLRLRR